MHAVPDLNVYKTQLQISIAKGLHDTQYQNFKNTWDSGTIYLLTMQSTIFNTTASNRRLHKAQTIYDEDIGFVAAKRVFNGKLRPLGI